MGGGKGGGEERMASECEIQKGQGENGCGLVMGQQERGVGVRRDGELIWV